MAKKLSFLDLYLVVRSARFDRKGCLLAKKEVLQHAIHPAAK